MQVSNLLSKQVTFAFVDWFCLKSDRPYSRDVLMFSCFCRNWCFHEVQIPALLFIFSPFWRLLAQIHVPFHAFSFKSAYIHWYWSEFICVGVVYLKNMPDLYRGIVWNYNFRVYVVTENPEFQWLIFQAWRSHGSLDQSGQGTNMKVLASKVWPTCTKCTSCPPLAECI